MSSDAEELNDFTDIEGLEDTPEEVEAYRSMSIVEVRKARLIKFRAFVERQDQAKVSRSLMKYGLSCPSCSTMPNVCCMLLNVNPGACATKTAKGEGAVPERSGKASTSASKRLAAQIQQKTKKESQAEGCYFHSFTA